MQLAAYRIVQEALTNALKHASPRTTVDLSLAVDSCRVHIVVHDSGPPDDEPTPAANRPEHRFNSRLRSARYEEASPGDAGLGLASIADRAALYGGTVSAGPAPYGGWTVHATLKGSHS
ncbi:ATP-binding protein [Nonomuraea sp. CA-143628]|uniref:ATP-binding protein n=1 Tax=Nonomuraea sp. CA-143628 TaxID=3239997 RepID=UPI003D9016A7